MATRRWLGTAVPVRQKTTLTVGGTIVAADVFTVVCGFSNVSIIAADTVAANVAAQLLAALQAGSQEFKDATWTIAGAVITGTGFPGVPFVVTSSATGSGTSTCVTATPTAASGPNYADVAANWSGGALPAVTDTVYVEANTPPILYGLTSITGLFARTVVESGAPQIGLPAISSRGYREYRQQWWSINTTLLEVGNAGTEVSGAIVKIDLKSTATTTIVRSTGQGTTTEPPLQLIGGASATATIETGTVAIADSAVDAAAYTTITVGAGANVKLGATCTHTTINTYGVLLIENTVTNLNVKGGRTSSSGTVTNLDVSGSGIFNWASNNTIVAALVGPGTLQSGDSRAKTVTTLTLRGRAQLIDSQGVITVTTMLKSGVFSISTN